MISVVVITRNSAASIERCMESIFKQSLLPTEVIVIDGHSDDDTLDKLGSFPVIQTIQTGTGIAQARNQAISLASQEWIGFLDSDDTWDPKKLEIQWKALQKQPELEAIGCYLEKWKKKERIASSIQPAFTPGGFIFHRSCFEKYGLFDTRWTYASDHAWFLGARRQGLKFNLCKEVLLHKHLHENNLSLNQKAYRLEVFELLKHWSE